MNIIRFIFLLASLVFVMSACLTAYLCRTKSRWYVVDHPNERSLHTVPTPRSGGLAIVVAALVGLVCAAVFINGSTARAFELLTAISILSIVSYIDDRTDLSPALRLLVQFGVAVALVMGDFSVARWELPGISLAPYAWIGGALSVLFIVWVINLYNFMDGMDGFAGGMGVIGFMTLAVFGVLAGNALFAGFSLTVAAAVAGFLLFNFPPARIFMGDVGSSSLGLLVAGMSIWGTNEGVFPFWVPLLIFSPFIVDATVTLIKRLLRGEKVWRPHKTHYYQRLVQLGWGHRRTVLTEYILMISGAGVALVAARAEAWLQWVAISAWSMLYLGLARCVTKLEKRRV